MGAHRSDQEIARYISLKPIQEITDNLGIPREYVELYGNYKAKVNLSIQEQYPPRKDAKYIVVTSMTPTPLGEGKTLTTIGLSQALNRIGKQAIATIRQPSMGPIFGIKGGATGGGHAQILPMEDINFHFTGDFHAIGVAHNLLSAAIENVLYHDESETLDPDNILWPRVMDLNDRSLRDILIEMKHKERNIAHAAHFWSLPASEVMAIVALSRNYADLKERLGNILVGKTYGGAYVRAGDLSVNGAMAALLRDTLKPNIVQTTEHTPCFVHTGPFGNIAHGNSSIVADLIGLGLSDYVVTESGFGADCGLEKCIDIKCRAGGLKPDAVVLVVSVRACKLHSGSYATSDVQVLMQALKEEDVEAVVKGSENVMQHIENVKQFGLPVIVAINRFPDDTDEELQALTSIIEESLADDVVCHTMWAEGGAGGEALAHKVIEQAEKANDMAYLYDIKDSIADKIFKVATKMYGAKDISILPQARTNIHDIELNGYRNVPVCIAKTPFSLSHDKTLLGRPKGFTVPIKAVRVSAGAGFVYCLVGNILTMPGLPKNPTYCSIDLADDGTIIGLF